MDTIAANRQGRNDECGRGWPLTQGLARTGLILLLAMPGGSALGDNQLVNFTFDENLDGWTLFAAPDEAAWDPLDVAGSPDSGSALLSQEEAGFLTMIGQCVPVTGGELHSMGSWIFVPGGQNADRPCRFAWPSCRPCRSPVPVLAAGRSASVVWVRAFSISSPMVAW